MVLVKLANLVCNVYFAVVNALFSWIYSLQSRKAVPPPTDPLLLLSATKAAAKIRARELRSADLIEAYIRRLEEVNPLLNAVVATHYEHARKKAAEVDAYLASLDPDSDEYASLPQTKPLLGLPYTTKDMVNVKGMKVTCGMISRRDTVVDDDADVVRNLNNAGAIHLAITNVPEGGMWVESSNAVYGRTNNPYDTRRTCGGSSGGEGAVVGAGASLIGVGSDLGGSIRIPSAFNGIFGLKGTSDTVSLEGHWPYVMDEASHLYGTIGPLLRYSEDLALVHSVFTGAETSEKLGLSKPVDVSQLTFYAAPSFDILGVEKPHEEEAAGIARVIKHFETKYKPVKAFEHPSFAIAKNIYFSGLVPEEGNGMQDLLNISPLSELFKMIIGVSTHTLAAVGFVIGRIPPNTREQNLEMRKKREELSKDLSDLLGDDGVAILPALPTTAPFHHQLLFTPVNWCYTALWNATGMPALVCPIGLSSDGVPLAVQFVAKQNNDRVLIAIAREMESAFGGWTPPPGVGAEIIKKCI